MKRLLVRPVGKALVPDYDAIAQRVLRFVGRRHDAKLGDNGGWVPKDEPVSVPMRMEYLQELRVGTLKAADAETARLAGVTFEEDK